MTEELAFKLIVFADKYVQDDLSYKCTDFLKHNITLENVYTILDFARQENIGHLRTWCVDFLKKKVDRNNIFRLVEYVNKQDNPEFAQENIDLRDKALRVITKDYFEISKEPMNPRYYENFLIKNIAFDTISTILSFINGSNYKGTNNSLLSIGKDLKKEERERERLEPEIKNLKPAVFDFTQDNMKNFHETGFASKFTNEFLVELVLYVTEKSKRLSKTTSSL